MTNEKAFRFAMKLSKIANLQLTVLEHIHDASNWVQKKTYKKPKFYNDYINFANEEYDKRRGVLSLTENPCLDRMWKDYADNSKRNMYWV